MEHNNGGHEDPTAGLFARGRSKEVGSSSYSRGKSRSKSRHVKEDVVIAKKSFGLRQLIWLIIW